MVVVRGCGCFRPSRIPLKSSGGPAAVVTFSRHAIRNVLSIAHAMHCRHSKDITTGNTGTVCNGNVIAGRLLTIEPSNLYLLLRDQRSWRRCQYLIFLRAQLPCCPDRFHRGAREHLQGEYVNSYPTGSPAGRLVEEDSMMRTLQCCLRALLFFFFFFFLAPSVVLYVYRTLDLD